MNSEKKLTLEEKEKLLSEIKPSSIDTNSFCGSKFRNTEKEIIARNIVFLAKESGDEWVKFSFDEYSNNCNHSVSHKEEEVMNLLVKDGYLLFENGKYTITPEFVEVILEFKDTDERRKKIEDTKKAILAEVQDEAIRKKQLLSELELINDKQNYELLENIVKKYGFGVTKLHRGDNFQSSYLAGKHEIWFQSKGSDSKTGLGDTLGKAVENAIVSLQSKLK